jgi:hypothetical protein
MFEVRLGPEIATGQYLAFPMRVVRIKGSVVPAEPVSQGDGVERMRKMPPRAWNYAHRPGHLIAWVYAIRQENCQSVAEMCSLTAIATCTNFVIIAHATWGIRQYHQRPA